MVLSGILFWITSITMHKYIMKNPQIKDICELAGCASGLYSSHTNISIPHR
jgi:hypothetical protein